MHRIALLVLLLCASAAPLQVLALDRQLPELHTSADEVWAKELQEDLRLAELDRYRSDALRYVSVDRETLTAKIIEAAILPERTSAITTVRNARLLAEGGNRDGQWMLTEESSRVITFDQFELLKHRVLALLLDKESVPPKSQAGVYEICTDKALQQIEVHLGEAAPLYIVAQARCTPPDPVRAASKVIEGFAAK